MVGFNCFCKENRIQLTKVNKLICIDFIAILHAHIFSSINKIYIRLCVHALICWCWAWTFWRSTYQTFVWWQLASEGGWSDKCFKTAWNSAFADLFLNILFCVIIIVFFQFPPKLIWFSQHIQNTITLFSTYHLNWKNTLPTVATILRSIAVGVCMKFDRTIWTTEWCEISLLCHHVKTTTKKNPTRNFIRTTTQSQTLEKTVRAKDRLCSSTRIQLMNLMISW